jgi:hypothetical protein
MQMLEQALGQAGLLEGGGEPLGAKRSRECLRMTALPAISAGTTPLTEVRRS